MNRLVKILSAVGAISLLALCFMIGAYTARIKLVPGSWITNDAEAQRSLERAYFCAQVDASRDIWRVKYLPDEDRWQWTSSPWNSGLPPQYQPQNNDFKLSGGK